MAAEQSEIVEVAFGIAYSAAKEGWKMVCT